MVCLALLYVLSHCVGTHRNVNSNNSVTQIANAACDLESRPMTYLRALSGIVCSVLHEESPCNMFPRNRRRYPICSLLRRPLVTQRHTEAIVELLKLASAHLSWGVTARKIDHVALSTAHPSCGTQHSAVHLTASDSVPFVCHGAAAFRQFASIVAACMVDSTTTDHTTWRGSVV